LSLRAPDMSSDMGLFAASEEAADSNGSEHMAVGWEDPLGLCGATGPSRMAAYVAPPSGGPSCRLLTAASSPVTDGNAGRGADPAPVAGRLLADSVDSPELASSLVFCLPATS
jgi:hypothetical protein